MRQNSTKKKFAPFYFVDLHNLCKMFAIRGRGDGLRMARRLNDRSICNSRLRESPEADRGDEVAGYVVVKVLECGLIIPRRMSTLLVGLGGARFRRTNGSSEPRPPVNGRKVAGLKVAGICHVPSPVSRPRAARQSLALPRKFLLVFDPDQRPTAAVEASVVRDG
jgi:hypothetical protein